MHEKLACNEITRTTFGNDVLVVADQRECTGDQYDVMLVTGLEIFDAHCKHVLH